MNMSPSDPEAPYTPGVKKETEDYLTPDFVPAERQDTRTSVAAAIGGGLPADPSEVDPPRESLRGCVVLLGCVLIAASNMGFGMSVGALQTYYSREVYTTTPESVIALIGGLIAFCNTGLAGIGGRAADSFGYKPTIFFGSIIGVIAILLDAFSTKLWQVFLTQGVLYGVGQAFTVPLILSLPSQWFFEHRGLATGLVGGSAGLGGALTSYGLRNMINQFGQSRTPLAIWAGLLAIVWACSWLLLRENRATPDLTQLIRKGPEGKRRLELVKRPGVGPLLRDHVFWSFLLCIFVSCFGYLCPFAYLTTYAEEVILPNMDPSKIGPLTSTWPLFCANMGLFCGRVIIGYTADKLGSIQSLVLSLEIAGLLQIVAWHFATTFESVMAFAFIYGLTGGAALSLIAPVIAQIYGARENMASIVGFAMLASGPGSLAGPTLSGAVLKASGNRWLTFQAVAGTLQMAGGLIGIWTWWYGVGPMRWGNRHSRRKK